MFFVLPSGNYLKRINWWLIIAALISLLYYWGVNELVATQRLCTPLELIDAVAYGFGILSIWGLSLRRRVFYQSFWRIFFFVVPATALLTWIVPGSPHPPVLLFWKIVNVGLTYIPYCTGMFIYAFRSKKIWDSDREEVLNGSL